MRTLTLILGLAAAAAGEDIPFRVEPGLSLTGLIEALEQATGATFLYPSGDLEGRSVGARYDFLVPADRMGAVADFLIRQCGLEVRLCPPVRVILPKSALETRFRAPAIESEIEFDRGPGGWTKDQDAEGSLSNATVETLIAEAARGKGAAVDLLAALGPRNPPTVGAVAKLLADPALRPRAATALARFGFLAKTALPALREAMKADPTIEAAVRAVEEARHPALLAPALATDTAPPRYVVRFETTAGEFDVEVKRDAAPLAADRFYSLVRIGYFDGCRFFRVVPGFVAQWGKSGDPEVNKRWYQATLKDEPVVGSNKRGTLSFAKMKQPDTRSTQVFVNLKDNAELDKQGFSPFGSVIRGMEVVDALYGGYGETPDQGHLHFKGEDYLRQSFPRLDRIKAATVIE